VRWWLVAGEMVSKKKRKEKKRKEKKRKVIIGGLLVAFFLFFHHLTILVTHSFSEGWSPSHFFLFPFPFSLASGFQSLNNPLCHVLCVTK